jgi:predicted flap endonuclease-1-like 5' DNA nuclease
MAKKANAMKTSRIEEEEKARNAISSKAKSEEEAENLVQKRINLEKQIKEDEKQRLRVIRIEEREVAGKLNAEEKILAERKAMQKAREDVKKKAEIRKKKEQEIKMNKQLEETEKERVKRELEEEIKEELERLRGEEANMTAKEYVLARVDAKGHLIDFGVIGRSRGRKDDLQMINGIDAGLEERLILVGITSFEQISKMTNEIADVVNDAIEHFPGRVRRQGWTEQAKVITEDSILNSI